MPGMAAKVVISERQQQVLQTMAFSRSCAKGLAHRAEIILLAFDGHKNEVIAEKLQGERHSVGIWRRRWQPYFERLTIIECAEKPSALREAIEEVLSDLPRAAIQLVVQQIEPIGRSCFCFRMQWGLNPCGVRNSPGTLVEAGKLFSATKLITALRQIGGNQDLTQRRKDAKKTEPYSDG